MRAWIVFISLSLMLVVETRASDQQDVSSQFAAIEQKIGGYLGVAALDTGDGRRIEYRATERFPLCSTFKFLLAAAILEGSPGEPLDRKISFGPDDLLEWAPVTKKHVSEGSMTVGDLCAAAIEYSDNTAANLLLRIVAGPTKLTEYIRSLGDPVTRVDRTEPSLNSALPGDERDTTTPRAMVSNLKLLLLGDRLSIDFRKQLEAWMLANTTGTKRIRAGLPPDWRVGDKTGTGQNGAASDIAIVRPPQRAPILIAIFVAQSSANIDQVNSGIAKAASLVAQSL
jgi:beta-lactamase class A